MIQYEFVFMCGNCREIFRGKSTVPLDPNFTGWYKGFMCIKCTKQMRLESFG